MKRNSLYLVAIVVAMLLAFSASHALAADMVFVVPLQGPVTPSTADFVSRNIQKANVMDAACVVVAIDTPGGLADSMKDIVQAMLASRIPVVAYVWPSGARAASAGVMITMAADVAAMAEGTNIGAAHPVSATGGNMDYTMAQKAVSDMAANARSVAQKRGRNAQWVEDAIRQSVSATQQEALELNVIDLLAKDFDDLIEQLDGMEIEGKGILKTLGAVIQWAEETWRDRLLKTLSNPNFAYIFFLLGLAGLYFEFSNPGAIFPGVIGAISLVLAFYSMQTLPVNYAGVLLILLAGVFFILEINITSFGALTIGGILALTLGSLMLFDSDIPALRVSFLVMIPAIAITSLFFIAIATSVVKAHISRPQTGYLGFVGKSGVVRKVNEDGSSGKVFVAGEIWNAKFAGPVKSGDTVRITAVEGLKLTAEKEE
jgi:membrane-bound serine protease (ClpP class)